MCEYADVQMGLKSSFLIKTLYTYHLRIRTSAYSHIQKLFNNKRPAFNC